MLLQIEYLESKMRQKIKKVWKKGEIRSNCKKKLMKIVNKNLIRRKENVLGKDHNLK